MTHVRLLSETACTGTTVQYFLYLQLLELPGFSVPLLVESQTYLEIFSGELDFGVNRFLAVQHSVHERVNAKTEGQAFAGVDRLAFKLRLV